MCNSRPGYRGGWALALREKGETLPETRLQSLGRDDAVALARDILANEAQICDDFVARFFATVPNAISEYADRGNDARLDFSHGVIIDFQNMFFETETHRHRARLCLTVCQHGKKSKIWFRSECVERKDEDGSWSAPVELTELDLATFFDEAEALAEYALVELQVIYQEYLQGYANRERESLVAKLFLAEQFEFKTFDTNSERLCELFFDLKKGTTFTKWVEARINANNERAAETALIAMNLAIRDDKPPHKTLLSMRTDGDVSIVDHASVDGELGVFIKRRIKVPGRASFKHSFVGAAYDPDAPSKERKAGGSPAYKLSAEMLAMATSSI